MPRGDDWRDFAACRGADPEIFFPISLTGPSADAARRAKEVCAGCPVRSACLSFAVRTGQAYGIWGGLTPEERRTLRAAARTREVAPAADRT